MPQEFRESVHIMSLGLYNATDSDIWNYAKRHGFVIVTFDSDFINLATLHGHPPKVILLKTGNRRTSKLSNLLQEKAQLIFSFIYDEDNNNISCLEIIE